MGSGQPTLSCAATAPEAAASSRSCCTCSTNSSVSWPAAPFWPNEAAFKSILGSTSRIIVASFTAYLISQLHDVWAFHFWRRKTRARHLWLRNNLSTMASQFIDSAIFINIAFYGVLPVWPLIAGQWIVKMAIAVLDTPVVYCVVGAMSARQGRKGAGAPREAAH